VISFGLSYGMTVRTLLKKARSRYGLDWTLQDAKCYLDRFLRLYTGLKRWQHETSKRAKSVYEYISPHTGRRRTLLQGPENVHRRFRCLLNTPAQGTIADAIKMAMVKVFSQLAPDEHLIANFHDEILLEVPEGRADDVSRLLQEAMTESLQALIPTVPVKVEASVCRSWAKD
jgi:DNA polymerase-1